MKNIIIITLLMISFNSYADKTITCGFNNCRPEIGLTPDLYIEKTDTTYLDLGSNNNQKVIVDLPENQDPRNLLLIVNNNSLIGQDISLNLNSKAKEKNTGNLLLIGDMFNNININLNGYDGASGKAASEICADNFKSGKYGQDALSYFNNRRAELPTLSISNCDTNDLQFLQNTKFACPNPDYSNVTNTNIEVQRIRYKQRCVGTSVRYKCVQRQMKIVCEWRSIAKGFQTCSDKNGCSGCSRRFGAADCRYDGNSCWSSDYGQEVYGTTYAATPTVNDNPAWWIEQNNSRCTATTNGSGGWFAYQKSELISEATYFKKNEEGKVEDICKQWPSPKVRQEDPAWMFNKVSDIALTYPGLDPDTLLPLPGSNWVVKSSDFFRKCEELGDFSPLNTEIQSWSTYGELGNECSDARIPEDSNNLIPWAKAGVVQDASFGLEKIYCAPDKCPVQSATTDTALNLDYIDPTAGANGTKQGNGYVIIYDYKTLNASSKPGIAGVGGNKDLPEVESTKYCVKVDDAVNHSVDSSFSKTPLVNFNIFKWKALKINRGEPSGSVPDYSTNSLKVFKKIDSSVRYLLQKEFL